MDDGNTATGAMMAAAEVGGVSAVSPIVSAGDKPTISDSEKYTVCMAF